MQKFQTTKTVLGFVTGLGILIFVLGAGIIAIMGIRDMAASLAVAVPVMLTGLSIVIACQLALAQIETANNTAAIRDLMQKQIDLLQYAPKPAAPPVSAREPLPAAGRHVVASSPHDVVKNHKGVDIIKTPHGYMAGGEIYYTIAEAERALDRG